MESLKFEIGMLGWEFEAVREILIGEFVRSYRCSIE